ncbi:hypothetical protein BGZ83_008819 [Gryganskiella cystojenkinii]|nr:hypothetical protein BGZ83_008819 [Gryganskiella cystojenkinii]
MAHLAAFLGRRTVLSTSARTVAHTQGAWRLTNSTATTIRLYSRKTPTRTQIETSELEKEIKQLERVIEEQERKLAAKKAYEDSIREANKRSEAAQAVYKQLSSPIPPTAPSPSKLNGNPIAQSYLPETFLRDLKLTFLDTRGNKGETLKRLQDGLPSTEELSAAVGTSSTSSEETEGNRDEDRGSIVSTPEEQDSNVATLERIKSLGVDKWNQLIYVNALEGNAKNAEQVLQLMEEVGVQPDLDSFGHLMEAYANAGDLTKAQKTIDMMLKTGLVPSMSSYNSLMKIHIRRRDITGAFQTFEALKKHHNPDTETFTNLVRGCLRAGEHDLGWKVFNQMQHSGATPVESTYSLMIHACAKTDQVEKALDIFRTYPTRNLQPTDATFNSLIHACAMRPEYFTTAFALLNEMQQTYGFEPDTLTYNTLLFACAKRRDLLTARRIFQKVVQLDSEGVLKLDGVTVTNFFWCITEWKDTAYHVKQFKLKSKGIETSTVDTTAVPASNSEKELTVKPPYFMLPQRPPRTEAEALAEGEMVFNWFVNRSTEEFLKVDSSTDLSTVSALENREEKDAEGLSTMVKSDKQAIDIPFPRLSWQSPIRTRLLNGYLAMYVRHQDKTKAMEIYRGYYDHFDRRRDSWTYATLLEGCYYWKDVDLGAEVFRDWRDWRTSTGKLTEKRTRLADYDCYKRMINLLARTNHLDESIALLEELSIAATPKNTRLRSQIAAATDSSDSSSSSTMTATGKSLSFLKPMEEEAVLPIYPKLKDFPVVYTKTWEQEDEGARKLLLRLCQGKVHSLFPSSKSNQGEDGEEAHDRHNLEEKRKARYQKSLRKTSVKWKGEHPQEKGFYVGSRRLKELNRNVSKRGQDS